MIILGVSCYYHDAAAAIIKDGQIIAAAEEERFSRKKHDSSFPKNAIDFCLKSAAVTPKELDYVVFYEKPFRKFHRILISSLSTYPRSAYAFREAMRIWLTQKLWIKSEIASYLKLPEQKVLFSQHHLSHAASCFYPSPYKESAIMTIDGVGEWATASYGIGQDNKITILKEIYYPQSLGLLYSTFTAFLGFEVNEGEWKVMGLAPYGKPKYQDKVWQVVKANQDGSFSLDFSYFSYQYSDSTAYSGKFIDLFGPPVAPQQSHLVTERSADLAASIQVVTEELLLNMAKNLHKATKLNNLCLAGGVALNSVANYRLLKDSGFKNIYIQPAAGDSGGALGAALYLYHHVLNKQNRQIQTNAYFGSQYDNNEIESALNHLRGGNQHDFSSDGDPDLIGDSSEVKIKKLLYDKLVDYISQKIIEGKVIGWHQGRFEWGPRALGNRSILADPRNPKMKDIINAKVKFREAFRPFAPSVLAEKANLVFDLPTTSNHYPLRFMLYVVPVKPDWRKKVPAITHADNTARPQVVFRKENPLYYSLIEAFYKKTGVPLLLNTSFNLKGEPIVNSPEDAYSTFQRSGIDILVMGNYVCEK
ncbi:hypothetical protein A2W14_03510 [Candidatus Gottesmanbacteria bacterium RBG_16_37_8]|uniref:Carbamoyltransferase n=1 Tax=Candidatus Gottesmanbacteria bacterium RBG_16_37_8 TaxID=1798371 RepID=A0A1F5YSR4_9BACT|nr:MAG: hypothetical protein A2W14_03510 [Candidatus Gottesmanbacteria bacterium RBG_16_37_8]